MFRRKPGGEFKSGLAGWSEPPRKEATAAGFGQGFVELSGTSADKRRPGFDFGKWVKLLGSALLVGKRGGVDQSGHSKRLASGQHEENTHDKKN